MTEEQFNALHSGLSCARMALISMMRDAPSTDKAIDAFQRIDTALAVLTELYEPARAAQAERSDAMRQYAADHMLSLAEVQAQLLALADGAVR
jgi:hypothetical protein